MDCISVAGTAEVDARTTVHFRDMAQCSLAALQQTKQRPFKRTKETSGAVGMSPDTAKQRPSSKVHCKNRGVLYPPNEQHTIGVISHRPLKVCLAHLIWCARS